MSDHSQLWHEKKSALKNKERVVKNELDVVSTDFEKRIKYVLVISLISGLVFLAFKFIFGIFRGKKSKNREKSIQISNERLPEKRASTWQPVKAMIMEKVAFAFIGFAMSQLKNIMTGNTTRRDEDLKDS